MNKRSVHFFGDGLWAYNSLKMLVDNNIFNIVAVVLRNKPDFKIKDLCDELLTDQISWSLPLRWKRIR